MEYHVFKHPYVLIEDSTGKYKPFHREYSRDSKETMIPLINFENLSNPKRTRPVKKAGVCEICVMKYADYEEHIKTEKHTETERLILNRYEEIDILSELLRKERKIRKIKKKLFT